MEVDAVEAVDLWLIERCSWAALAFEVAERSWDDVRPVLGVELSASIEVAQVEDPGLTVDRWKPSGVHAPEAIVGADDHRHNAEACLAGGDRHGAGLTWCDRSICADATDAKSVGVDCIGELSCEDRDLAAFSNGDDAGAGGSTA